MAMGRKLIVNIYDSSGNLLLLNDYTAGGSQPLSIPGNAKRALYDFHYHVFCAWMDYSEIGHSSFFKLVDEPTPLQQARLANHFAGLQDTPPIYVDDSNEVNIFFAYGCYANEIVVVVILDLYPVSS